MDSFCGMTSESLLPTLRPPQKTKLQLLPDPVSFTELDTFVINTPQSASKSVESLAAHLTSICSTDLQRIRALFCWVAYNIAYDTEEDYFSSCGRPQDAISVLQDRKAVCRGYAQLLQSLCKLANISCLIVSGFAKGYGYDPEDEFTSDSKTNHDWNIVFMDGEWRPLDVTWAAGYLAENKSFQRQFCEHWFLTDPAEFIFDHFPLMDGNLQESEKYQLLKRPINIERFSASVRARSLAYVIGLKCLTHSNAIIKVRRDVTIRLKATRQPLEAISVTLTERGSLPEVRSRSNVLSSLSADGTCTIYVRPARASSYLLVVMGRGQGQEKKTVVHELLSYVIKCSTVHPNQEPFPDKADGWGIQYPEAVNCGLEKVKNRAFTFYANSDGEVRVFVRLKHWTTLQATLAHASSVSNQMESSYTFVSYTKNKATVCARLQKPGYYLLRVFASQRSADLYNFQRVADFLLFAAKGNGLVKPFPQAFLEAHQGRVTLLQPTSGQVPATRVTLFRVYAPTFSIMKIADVMMEMTSTGCWEAAVKPDEGVSEVIIFGARRKDADILQGLYKFSVV